MEVLEAEMVPEFPPETTSGKAEISAIPSGNASQTYSSAELAQIFKSTDRTVRNWLKRIRETYYWLEDALQIDGRYTLTVYRLLCDYKHCCVDGGEVYEQYRSRIWKEQAPNAKPATTDTAIVLSAHRDETLATRQIQEGTRVLDGVKEDLRQAYRQQPTLARALAKRFAGEFKKEFASAYAEEVSQAVSEVLEVSQFER